MRPQVVFALAVLVVGVVMAAPLGAQALQLKANIPFEFSFAGRTLPAGEYVFQAEASSSMLRVRGWDGGVGAVGQASHPVSLNGPRTEGARINFNKYGNSLFLSSVVDGYSGARMDLPTGVNERELARTASAQKIQIVATTAGL